MATNFGQFLNNSVGGLIGLPKATSIQAILRYVQRRLPRFARENRNQEIENENGLTQALVKLLNNKHIHPFNFDKEYMEDESKGNSPRSDFSVVTNQAVKFHAHTFADRQRIFTFEAKRLTNLGKAREKEYLVGRYEGDKFINAGGVERFKNCTHAIALDQVGLIGYLQMGTFEQWEKRLNLWIDELISNSPTRGDRPFQKGINWKTKDKLLATMESYDFAVYQSTNTRGMQQIVIHHIWVNLIN